MGYGLWVEGEPITKPVEQSAEGELDLPRSAIRLVSGANSRSKTIMITGGRVDEVTARLGL